MDKEQIIDFLLKNASDNIKYRILRDVLHRSPDLPEMQFMQAKILELPKVKKMFANQKADGFLGDELHGGFVSGFDTNIYFLKINGVEISNPNLQRAKQSLLNWTEFEQDSFYKAGNAMDEHDRGGFKAIIADLLLELGCDEDTPQIKDQIDYALAAFKGSLQHNRLDDFSKECSFKGEKGRYYIKRAHFPSATHLKMLSKTKSWRSTENLKTVETSYEHCKMLMNDYHSFLYVNCGYYVGPFNIDWHAREILSINEFKEHSINFAWWMKGLLLSQYNLLGRKQPIDKALTDWIFKDEILSELPDEYLRQFKNYVSIEPSWRKKESIMSDLYFPAILALCNAAL